MADTAKRIGPTQLTTSAVTQYTTPASTTTILRNIHVANNTGTEASVTLSIGADAAATRFFDQQGVPARGSLDWSGFIPLAATEIVQALASVGSALVLTIGGVEVT